MLYLCKFQIILCSMPKNKNKRQLFSRRKLMISRNRARYLNLDNIIYNHISEDISNRLSEINRLFESVLIITKNRNIEAFDLSKKSKGKPLIISPLNLNITDSKIVDDEEVINLRDNSFDLIISDLLIHTSNNFQGSLDRIKSLLKPDGLMIATLFGTDTLTELKYSLIEAEEKITGNTYPRVNPFIDIKSAGDLLYNSGFKLCVSDNYRIEVKNKSPLELIKLIRSMGENNYINLDKPNITKKIWDITSTILGGGSNDCNAITSTFEIITLTGWKFHESQQKPLSPGSAKINLKDVLKN